MKGQVLGAAPRWAVWPTDRQATRITYSVTGQGARLSPVASAGQIAAVDTAVCPAPRALCAGSRKVGCSQGVPCFGAHPDGARHCCSCLAFRGFNGDAPTACRANEAKCHGGETILIPFPGGAEGREEVGNSKCHTGLELECCSGGTAFAGLCLSELEQMWKASCCEPLVLLLKEPMGQLDLWKDWR